MPAINVEVNSTIAIKCDTFVLQQQALEIDITVQVTGAQLALGIDNTVPGYAIGTNMHCPAYNASMPYITKCSGDLAIRCHATLWN